MLLDLTAICSHGLSGMCLRHKVLCMFCTSVVAQLDICNVCNADIRMLILLTKIDAYDPDIIAEDLKRTFHSARLQVLMEVSAKHCLPLTGVHPSTQCQNALYRQLYFCCW